MTKLGILINCKEQTVEWEEAKIAMATDKTNLNRKKLLAVLVSTQEPISTTSEKERLVNILDADYKSANLPKVV